MQNLHIVVSVLVELFHHVHHARYTNSNPS